jgi:hypothetical protein
MREPLLSVVMPVFNAGPFLDGAIRSILDQTFASFEFVIADDGSTGCRSGPDRRSLRRRAGRMGRDR